MFIEFTNYLNDGRLDICNNFAENQFRSFAVGRKSWGHQISNRRANASAVLYSLANTCKIKNINPFEYFTMALGRAPYCETIEDWEKLVPT